MKSRTSFFNGTVLRKDITRFLPVWLIYLIGSLLIGLDSIGGYSNGKGYQAYDLARSISAYGVINFFYALVCAQVLFGDLFKSKLCNALHAMPVRRESWFLTHTIAGIAFSLVPNFILSLCFMPYMDGMWYVSLFWLLGVTLEYLFFFALAAVCAVCAGNRLGMTAIYGITNFLSMIAVWFITNCYEPLLYGIRIRYDKFELFCPVIAIAEQMDNLVVFDVAKKSYYPGYYEEIVYTYTYKGLGNDWGYLAILAVLGVALLGLGMLLYRKRKLECAGDLLAFQPMKPVFTVIFTLSAGAVSEAIMGGDLTFLIVGIIVGYFVCQMLMQRTIKVFRKKEILKCGAIGLALVVSILLTMWDPLGITRWVPNPDRVESIILSNSYHFEYDADENNKPGKCITNPVLIRELTAIHEQALTESSVDKYNSVNALYLVYQMKDGRTIERRYYYRGNSETDQKLKKFFGTAEYVLDYENWDEFIGQINGAYANWDWDNLYPTDAAVELAKAIKADCESSDMTQNERSDYAGSVTLTFQDGTDWSIDYFHSSKNIKNWIEKYCH